MKIYKKSVPPECRSTEITCCARVLSCANQYDQITIWYIHDDSAPKETIIFQMTGESLNPKGFFLGTMLFDNGEFILHAFQLV